MSATKQHSVELLQERIKSLRESVDRADALASVQARTITVLEGSLALYDARIAELNEGIKIMREAL
jgi:hypothetical protein